MKDKFKEIKMRNERLKTEKYAQLFKLYTPGQSRLMSTFDITEGKMHVSFIQPNVQQPRVHTDYKKVDFEVLAGDVHLVDQIEFQKQNGEIIYSTLIGKSIYVHPLQSSLNNILAQYQLEKDSSQAKDNRIKSLEDLIIEMGHDPKDIKAIEELIKQKNKDIASLKKQLKIPSLHHPQTQEVLQSQTQHEDLMDIVLKLNDQLRSTDKELDALIQLKKGEVGTTSKTVIPTVTTEVPSTLVATLAPKTTIGTTFPITTTTYTTIVGTTIDEAAKLFHAMEEISIQTNEINKLKE